MGTLPPTCRKRQNFSPQTTDGRRRTKQEFDLLFPKQNFSLFPFPFFATDSRFPLPFQATNCPKFKLKTNLNLKNKITGYFAGGEVVYYSTFPSIFAGFRARVSKLDHIQTELSGGRESPCRVKWICNISLRCWLDLGLKPLYCTKSPSFPVHLLPFRLYCCCSLCCCCCPVPSPRFAIGRLTGCSKNIEVNLINKNSSQWQACIVFFNINQRP